MVLIDEPNMMPSSILPIYRVPSRFIDPFGWTVITSFIQTALTSILIKFWYLLYVFVRKLGSSVDKLVEEFEIERKPDVNNYSRKLVEFCSAKAVADMFSKMEEQIGDGAVSRFTFDMMLAWQMPSFSDEQSSSVSISLLDCITTFNIYVEFRFIMI